jgi:NitT/TauT family transport system substrate-binding protein
LEKATRDHVKLRGNDADAGAVIPGASRRIGENRFIVHAHADGENDFPARHIRNSISLTMRGTRRMICASHQRGAGSAGGRIFSQRSSVRNMRNANRCADSGAVPAQEWGLMDNDNRRGSSLDRRHLLQAGLAAAFAAPLGAFGAARAFAPQAIAPGVDLSEFPLCRTASDAPALTGAPRKLKLSWNAGAVCLAPVPVAIEHGFFQKHNLDVELINYSGSTDQLLEAIATGKSDAGLGMALRWLKPLEQGFDVKIAAGTHGGCMRVLTRADSSVSKLADLKGKIVAVGDLGGPDKNFFSIQLAKLGIDPNKDVYWRAYPGNLLNVAVEKGEVQAFLSSDPLGYLWLKDTQYKEVASNLDGEYRDKSCCILGLRGSLVREEPQVARALTQALLDAAMFTAQNPAVTAKSFQPYAPKTASIADIEGMVRYHTHHHHPVGDILKRELKAYADDLKSVQVFKQSTDTAKFAERIYVDVFAV